MGRLRKVSLEIHQCVHKAKKNNNEKTHDKATPAPMEKKLQKINSNNNNSNNNYNSNKNNINNNNNYNK